MLHTGTAFFWGAVLSFGGSMAPGMIILRVWEASLQGTNKKALYIALGATSIEVCYAALALHLNLLAYHVVVFYPYAYFFVALLMLFFAYRSYRTRTSPPSSTEILKKNHRPLQEGVLLGLGNLLPIPFWIAITLYMQEQGLVNFDRMQVFWGYIFGIGVGTWLFLCVVVYLSKYMAFLVPTKKRKRQVFSWIYTLIALYFIYKGMLLL